MRSATGEYSLSPSRKSDFGMAELDESRNGNGIGLPIFPEEIPKSIAKLYELVVVHRCLACTVFFASREQQRTFAGINRGGLSFRHWASKGLVGIVTFM